MIVITLCNGAITHKETLTQTLGSVNDSDKLNLLIAQDSDDHQQSPFFCFQKINMWVLKPSALLQLSIICQPISLILKLMGTFKIILTFKL